MSDNNLQPLRRQELIVGIPVAFPIYDAQRNLLLNVGQLIHSEKQLKLLFEMGLFRNPLWRRPQQSPVEQAIAELRQASAVDDDIAMPESVDPRTDQRSAVESKRSFSQLKLLPGTVFQILSVREEARPRSAHKLVGWQDRTGILLSSINAQGVVVPFREGEVLVVRLMAGKEIVTFKAEVQKVCFSPFPYLHLAWPESLQRQHLRKNLRVNTRLIVSANLLGDTRRLSGCLLNLSAGGAQLTLSDATLNKGDELQLAIRLAAAGQEHVLLLDAVVRNVSVENDADVEQAVRYGLEFMNLAVEARLVLENCILQSLVDA